MGVRYEIVNCGFFLFVFIVFLLFLGVLHTERKATVCSDRAGSSGLLVETLFFRIPP